jgi:H+/Cl- antiporter ClcA
LFGTKRLLLAGCLGLAVASIAVFVDQRTIGGGISLIEELLFKDGERASWSLIGGRLFSTILAHLSGCAGGFLAPSLSLGAVIGSKFATIISYPVHKLMVMIGMAGFLGAITRAPFTALVIVMEMTESHAAIFPLMLAAVVASGTVRLMAGRLAK